MSTSGTQSSSRTASTSGTPSKPAAEEPKAAAAAAPKRAAPGREQKGGTILEDGRPVGYTREGALSATKGGPVDPTILPEEAPAAAPTSSSGGS